MTDADSHVIEYHARANCRKLIRNRCRAIILLVSGMIQEEVAEAVKVARSTIVRWHAIWKKSGLAGLLMTARSGPKCIVPDEKLDMVRECLLEMQHGQKPANGVEMQQTLQDMGFSMTLSCVYNLPGRIRLTWKKPRPFNPSRDEEAARKWERELPTTISLIQSAYPGKKIDVWCQDETRFGQKGIVVREWSPRGETPLRARQNGFQNAWISGAFNPVTGEKYGLVTSNTGTEFTQIFLDEFSKIIPRNSQAVLIWDNAPTHTSRKLKVPENVTILPLPPYCPELNPAERMWRFLKQRYLCNQIYSSLDEILKVGEDSWRKITNPIVRSVCAWNYELTCVSHE